MSYRDEAIEVLEHLNKKAGKHFRPSDVNLDLIIHRLKSGITKEELIQIVDKKERDWRYKDGMSQYLRPATLFNATKCEQYLGELESPSKQTFMVSDPQQRKFIEDLAAKKSV